MKLPWWLAWPVNDDPHTGPAATACPVSVALEQDHPRLSVTRDAPGAWWWIVTGPDGEVLDSGRCSSWAEGLAVGLAALETASVSAVG